MRVETASTGPAAHAASEPSYLSITLVGCCLVVATMTSLGAPLVPSVADAMHVSLSTAQWILTAALLTGGLSTPVLGHLADGPHQRAVVLSTLTVLLCGSVLALVAPTFVVLVIARALQGCGFGIVPVTMAIARRHQAAPHAVRTVATLSVTTAVGVGLGYPMAGLLDTVFGYRSAFCLGVAVVCVALAVAWRRLPSSSVGNAVLDAWSSGLMCISLSGVILVLSEGENWGWSSPLTLVIGLLSLVLMVVWIGRELRLSDPLVQLQLIRHRAVLTADVSTFLVSAAMYLYLPVAIDIVQSPPRNGVGLGQSVVVSGLMLLPMSAVTVVSSMAMSRIARIVGQRALVPVGSLAFAAAMTLLALQQDRLWDAFISMSLLGLGCGLTFAAMPRMITSAVSPAVTGHAMALYQVLRGVGMAVGSAVCGVLLAVWTDEASPLPSVAGYRASLLAGAALCLATAVVSWVLPRATQLRPNKVTADPLDESALIEAAELGRIT